MVRLVEAEQVERAGIVTVSSLVALALDDLAQQPFGLGGAQPGQANDRQRPAHLDQCAIAWNGLSVCNRSHLHRLAIPEHYRRRAFRSPPMTQRGSRYPQRAAR